MGRANGKAKGGGAPAGQAQISGREQNNIRNSEGRRREGRKEKDSGRERPTTATLMRQSSC